MPERAPVELDAAAIRRYLVEVAEVLDGQPQQTLILVGGSLLALRGLRTSTRDVDSIRALSEATRQAAACSAVRSLPARTPLGHGGVFGVTSVP